MALRRHSPRVRVTPIVRVSGSQLETREKKTRRKFRNFIIWTLWIQKVKRKGQNRASAKNLSGKIYHTQQTQETHINATFGHFFKVVFLPKI